MTLRPFAYALATAVVLCCCSSTSTAQTLYHLEDLGQLDGVGSYATGINESGQASGWLIDSTHDQRAGRSVANRFQIPPGLEDEIATAGGINAHGDLAGSLTLEPWPTNLIHAMRYSEGTGIDDLGTLGGHQAEGTAINLSGQVVGWSYLQSGNWHAFLSTPGESMRDLGTLGGLSSYAGGINDLGQVSGYAQRPDGSTHAVVFTTSGGMQDLGAPYGESYGEGINSAGQVACSMLTAAGRRHACRYTPGVGFEDLDPVATRNSRGWAINDKGDVVGSFSTSLYAHAFVYTNTDGFVDLNTRILSGGEGWILVGATGINSAGEIVGTAQYSNQGPPRGFKLIPADLTPPVIAAATASPSGLWPPDGRMVPVQLSVAATDNTDPAPPCGVTGVAVSEPNSAADAIITGDLSLTLRAKRDTHSTQGRTYTATLTCSDASGNTATTTVTVTVPHDSGTND